MKSKIISKLSFLEQLPFRKYFSHYEYIDILLCVVFFTIWNVIATKTFSLLAVIFFTILCVFSLFLGKILLRAVANNLKLQIDFPFAFICGFFILNTALFIMAFLTPFSIIQNFIIVFIFSIIACFCLKSFSAPSSEEINSTDGGLYGLLITIIGLIGVTIWIHVILSPIRIEGDIVIFKPWNDIFWHSWVIRMLGDAHGISSFQYLWLSGEPAVPYHYASYVIPALFSVFANLSRYIVFASFFVPLGIFLMILGAYSLIKSFWGPVSGLIAATALLLLPDAAQQGFSNYFLSYHWFIPTAPASAYGITVISIAWIFLFRGCKASAINLIIIGYFIALSGVLYKAQFFLANSFLILIFPCLFMKNIVLKKRFIWLIASVSIYFLAVNISRNFENLPYLNLKCANMIKYLQAVISSIENIQIRDMISGLLEPHVTIKAILLGSAILLTFTFGFFLISTFIAFILLRKKIEYPVFFFPVLIIINYLVMSLGLSYDRRGIWVAEANLHNPFVWAYYVLVIWSFGGLAFIFFKNGLPKSLYFRSVIVAVFACLLFSEYISSRNIIQGPSWGAQYVNFKAPADLVRVCSFIRDNSNKSDVVQDSKNDPDMLITGISERQGYAVNAYSKELQINPVLKSRLDMLENFKMLKLSDAVIDFAKTNRIKWFILRPDDNVLWPQSFVNKPFYQSGSFRLYKF